MFTVDVSTSLGNIDVKTTQNKGLSPEHWTERIMEKIIELLQQVLDISKSQDSNELSLTTDLEEDIEIFIRKTNEREE